MQKRTDPGRRAGRMGARQIYEALRDQIMSLVYGTDGLLPSSRALADEMGVARSTVTVAYEQLAAEGFIETRHGARPRVARSVVERVHTRATSRPSTHRTRLSAFGERLRQDPPHWTAPPRGLVANFRYGELSPSDFPVLAWKKAVTAAMARKPERLAYDDPCGALRLRTALQEGLQTERLDEIAARLAYVTPSHQYPLGGVMPIGRRHQLLGWARQNDAYVIEDDYDSEYRYDTKPIPPLYALEGSDNVIYLGTVSKTLSPTLRIGYLVVPQALRSLFAAAKQIMDRHTPLIEQEALAAMLESGAYDSHVRRVRRRNAERQQALLDALRRRFGDCVRIEGRPPLRVRSPRPWRSSSTRAKASMVCCTGIWRRPTRNGSCRQSAMRSRSSVVPTPM